MSSGTVFSETLQSITTAKLSELSNKRAAFEARHKDAVNSLQAQSEPLARITALLEGVKQCLNIESGPTASSGSRDGGLQADLRRLDRFLEQAHFDPSLSSRILAEWETTLIRHMDVQLRRYQYATLYGQLVTEWLSPDKPSPSGAATGPSGDVEMSESFDELPSKKRLEAREAFEKSVFEPADVDTGAIKQYLGSLFSDDASSGSKKTSKALQDLRTSTADFEAQHASPNQFTTATVARAIRGLLKTDLFAAGEKRTVLKNFQSNSIILSEVADVLNMRMSALSTWSWGSEGVPIEQRRKLNGRFDIYMHEDLLQAIFLQYIGVEWSVFFKSAFKTFRRAAWKSNFREIPRIERKRREYYLGQQETDGTLQRKRRRTYRRGYFMYHLRDSAEQEIELKDGEEEADFQDFAADEEAEADMGEEFSAPVMKYAAVGRGAAGGGGAMRHRRIRVPKLDDEESEDEVEAGPKKPMEMKKDLLHLLSTEAAVNKRVHGSFTAFRSGFEELQNSLPHEAVMTVLDFLGVSKTWLKFFRTFLQAPLRFLDAKDDYAVATPRKRMRGAPASHTLSDVFSETMLFCADFSINRRAEGSFLYRLADDFWYWSHDHKKAVAAWVVIQKFADIMSLVIDHDKSGAISIGDKGLQDTSGTSRLPTGRIRWGMMFFDPGSLRFKIDQKLVDTHIDELRKQLEATSSVFDWIQVWNAYANTFFSSNFGKAANCFGRQHVDDILATHQRIQKTVFGGEDVVQHLKSMIAKRFGMNDIADGFLFFPVELGGLELQSPFVSPLQIRESVVEHPSKILDEFETNEREDYENLKARFDKGQAPDSRGELDDPNWKPAEGADEFMSFDEYTKYREEFTTTYAPNHILDAYEQLLRQPSEQGIDCSPAVQQAVAGLASHNHLRGVTSSWYGMDAYWKWIAQLYGPEMIDQFGGLSVVESGLLPIGMVGLFRDQKVKWQG